MFVCCECCVLSGRGLCDELITRPEESYRLWCVVVCDLETSRIGAPYIYDISCLRVKHIHRTEYHQQARLKTSGSKIDCGRDEFISPDPGNTGSVPVSYYHTLSSPVRTAAEAITHNLFMTEKR